MGIIKKLIIQGWKDNHLDNASEEEVVAEEQYECSIEDKEQKSALARLIAKVYGVDPLICPRCGSAMEICAIIMDPDEIIKILKNLFKIGRAPPNLDLDSLN